MDESLRARVAERFNLRPTGPAEQVDGGDESEIWKLGSDRGPVVVRMSPRWKTDDELRWVHDLIRHVNRTVPEAIAPIASSDGTTLIRHDGYPVSVFPCVDGEMMRRPATPDLVRMAGDILARAHGAMATFPDRDRPPFGAESYMGRPQVDLPDDLRDADLIRWHDELPSTGQPTGLVHGDFYGRNLLVSGGRIVALLDWDEAHRDYIAQELAWSMWELSHGHESSSIDDRLASAFLDGYVSAGATVPPDFRTNAISFIRLRLLDELQRQLTAKAHGEPFDDEYFAWETNAFESLRNAELFGPRFFADTHPSGRAWSAALPDLLDELTAQWDLVIDGEERWNGAHGIAMPVRRGGDRCVLKISWDDDASDEARALTAWDGNGAVRLLESRPDVGAVLLERLSQRTLCDVELHEAAEIAGTLLARLSIPAPRGFPKLRDLAEQIADSLPQRQRLLGDPVPQRWVDAACGRARELATVAGDRLVHSDLHYGNVLEGTREQWLAIDPRPVTGDPEMSVPEFLWSRHDEIDGPHGLTRLLDIVARSAELDDEKARSWVIVRCVEYWIWGLENGLTEDPIRCRRILEVLA